MFPGKLPKNLTLTDDFPHKILDIPHIWIPLSDGTRLAARLWRPVVSDNQPVPTILEYIPYRKTDGRRADDEQIHPYFAGHGYACLRVDIRGSGDSEGHLAGEYLRLEQDDAVEIISWIAAQSWCDGNVGMMGLSWGGFNSLQTAARRPAPLKAIIAVGATVDRYNDDVHYKQGCLLNEHFGWGSSFTAFQTRPPDPAVVGDSWRKIWLDRLKNLPFYAEKWFEHPTRDSQWKHGSICEDFSAIKAATMIVSGWGDLYVNAIPELLTYLDAPCRSIIGPWAHQFPHLATPGPAIDFLGEALSWWDRWLKEDDGEATIPAARAFIPASHRPNPYSAELPGRWVEAKQWPLETGNSAPQRWFLTADGLSRDYARPPSVSVCSPVDTGTASGELIPHCLGPEMPLDQRHDDAGSLCFDSPPLEYGLDVWGEPELTLSIRSDRPTGHLIVRLCDVWPDGSSERVALGMLNLALRNGLESPEPIPTDEPITIRIKLDHMAHHFAAGQRIRVAISTHYWPLVWPSPDHPTITLADSDAIFDLPVCTQLEETHLAPPTAPSPCPIREIRPATNERRYVQNHAQMRSELVILDDYGAAEYVANGIRNSGIKREKYTINWNDPLSATAEIHWTQEVGRSKWHTRTETRARMSCDRDYFYLETEVEAFENETKIWSRASHVKRPRL